MAPSPEYTIVPLAKFSEEDLKKALRRNLAWIFASLAVFAAAMLLPSPHWTVAVAKFAIEAAGLAVAYSRVVLFNGAQKELSRRNGEAAGQ